MLKNIDRVKRYLPTLRHAERIHWDRYKKTKDISHKIEAIKIQEQMKGIRKAVSLLED